MNKNWIKYLAVSFVMLQAVPVISMAAVNSEQTAIQLFTKETSVSLEAGNAMTYDKVAISHVSNYVNVRAEANTTSAIVGKIYNNCAAVIVSTVQGEDGTWYQIESGNVNGYIKAQYFVTGTEAENLAKQVGTEFARIKNATTLRLREEPSLESKTLTLLAEGAEYIVEEETGEFAKISVDNDLTGYVSKDYIETWVVFDTAVTLEEEKAKQEETDKLKQEAEDAIQKLESVKQQAEGQQNASGNTSGTASQGSSEANESSSQSTNESNNETNNELNNQSNSQSNQSNSDTANSDFVITPIEPTGGSSSQGAVMPGAPSGSSDEVTLIAPGDTSGTSGTNSGNNATNPSGNLNNQANSSTNTNTNTNTNANTSDGESGNSGNTLTGNKPTGTESTGNTSTGTTSSGNGPSGALQNPSGNTSSNSVSSNKEVQEATRTAIVAYAKQFLGNPYVYGGTSLTNGADCSGFVQSIFKHFGITTGRSSRDQAKNGKTIAVKDAQPGDLLFYASGDYINHVAIYIGGNQVIHASNSRTGIIISPANYRTPCKAVTLLD